MKSKLFSKMSGIAICIIAFSLFGCATAGSNDSSNIKKWVSAGALIVDVRTPEEFKAENYKNSINIPVTDIEKNIKLFGDKNRLIIVYCGSGKRSGQAKDILEKHGFNKVLDAGALPDMPK